jgi:hypothetical protein
MAKKRHNIKRIAQDAWSAEDRQAFADGNILKAQQIPNRRKAKDKRECRDFRWQG